ncbi:MAG: lyase family protein [Phenylobacterium sp.]|jgi:3-carboxy-cis,cis-muconate cycloisomerase
MVARIHDLAASTAPMLEVFGDRALVAAALAFESALARAQVLEDLIAAKDAAAILAACDEPFDIEVLALSAAHAGTLAIPLVEELRRRADRQRPGAGASVHLGATSQDVADTALALQAKAGLALLATDANRLIKALTDLAQLHAATPMLARTLLQAAAPTTFGLKAAQWRASIAEAAMRLDLEGRSMARLQLGGAVGTLAGQADRGLAVARRMSEELGLAAPAAPWHARREGVAGLGAALAILTGVVAKIAQDVALMAQAEVGEAFEPRVDGRGGSSAMPLKRNPTGCQVALSASLRTPHLAATLMSTLTGEHERGLGGWQAQAPVLADLFALTHGAVTAMAEVVEGLEVDVAAMTRNLAAAGVGSDVGEAEALIRRLLVDP